MRQRRMVRSAAVLAMVVGALVASSCTPASGLPTRKFALDGYCTLEVRTVQDGTNSYVAARKYGLQWVDKELTGGTHSEGCGTWVILGISMETDQGTNTCNFSPQGHPGAGCTGYAPDWYQAAEPGDLVTAHVGLCRQSTPYECGEAQYFGGGLSVYP